MYVYMYIRGEASAMLYTLYVHTCMSEATKVSECVIVI